MPMTHSEYCVNVCGGKCCTFYEADEKGNVQARLRCPDQLPSGACGIYDQWKDNGTCGKFFQEINNIPMGIEQAIEQNLLPDFIKDQCCYAHPELLNQEE